MIRLEGAGLRRGPRWIFRGLDLRLETGRTLALLGPNGRGKTTLIRSAAGLLPLDEGRREAPPVIGYVPQSVGATTPYRVLDFVVMGRARRLGLFGSPGRADKIAAEASLERVGMTAFALCSVDRLSGGERQLVLLARALATGSSALVLDEPLSALDLANQGVLLRVLADLRADRHHAILFSTHAPDHALFAADDAILMMSPEERLVGPVDPILSEANLSRLYGVPIRRGRIEGAEGSGPFIDAVVPLFRKAGA